MSNHGHVATQDGYVASVRAIRGFPRGYPWAILVWYAIGAVIVATFEQHYLLTGLLLGLAVLAAGVLFDWALWNGKAAAFRARPEGIRLGGTRHSVILPWDEIQEIRISPGSDGLVTEIILLPSAPFVPRRFSPAAEVLLTLVPLSFLFLKPSMLTPLTGPVRYSVPLCGATADEIADGLRPLVPDSVPITR